MSSRPHLNIRHTDSICSESLKGHVPLQHYWRSRQLELRRPSFPNPVDCLPLCSDSRFALVVLPRLPHRLPKLRLPNLQKEVGWSEMGHARSRRLRAWADCYFRDLVAGRLIG